MINSFFNLWQIPLFIPQLIKMIFFHQKMAKSILNPQHRGVRAWEYGLLLSRVPFKKGMKVLDLGSGGSALPFYLAKLGMKVTAFDLEKPEERLNQSLMNKFPQVVYDHGSMLNLPYPNNSYDYVLSISAIEHLDFIPKLKKTLPYSVFISRVEKALSEMVRVLKPGGKLFLTSDIYYPNLQADDKFSSLHKFKKIRAVFKKDDFEKVFLKTLNRLGCSLVGSIDFDFDKIKKDQSRSIYRGRFFTTFAIYAQKRA